jgi:hypothetical protein
MHDDSSVTLDYTTVGIAPKQRKWPLSSMYSLIFILIQIPWTIPWIAIAFEIGPPKNNTALAVFLFFIVVAAPTLLSAILGCYSLWIFGITPRNIFGVIALAYVVLEMIWILHSAIWTAIARFPFAVSTSAVLLSLVLWRAAKMLSQSGVRVASSNRRRDLLNVLFTALAALPLPVILIILLQREPSACVWSWNEPQKQIADNNLVRLSSLPWSETVIAPGIQRVRTPIRFQEGKGFYVQYVCEIRVATELLVVLLAIVPVSWGVFRLAPLLRWMAH